MALPLYRVRRHTAASGQYAYVNMGLVDASLPSINLIIQWPSLALNLPDHETMPLVRVRLGAHTAELELYDAEGDGEAPFLTLPPWSRQGPCMGAQLSSRAPEMAIYQCRNKAEGRTMQIGSGLRPDEELVRLGGLVQAAMSCALDNSTLLPPFRVRKPDSYPLAFPRTSSPEPFDVFSRTASGNKISYISFGVVQGLPSKQIVVAMWPRSEEDAIPSCVLARTDPDTSSIVIYSDKAPHPIIIKIPGDLALNRGFNKRQRSSYAAIDLYRFSGSRNTWATYASPSTDQLCREAERAVRKEWMKVVSPPVSPHMPCSRNMTDLQQIIGIFPDFVVIAA